MEMSTQYQQLVALAAEMVNSRTGDGCHYTASLVAQSHAQTVTDVVAFRADVRRAYLDLRQVRK